jgi:opacity protein-like surface antigen
MNFTRSRCLALGFFVTILTAGHAAAESYYGEGLYGWYEGGPALVEDAKIRDFFGEAVAGSRVKFDTGFHFGLGIGREVTDYFRVELESGFNYNSLKSIDDAAASSGNIYRVPVLGNIVLQYPNRTRLTPVIGAGVGAHWVALDAQNIELGSTVLDDSGNTWVFGYQGYGGLRYQFNERMNVGVFYHYSVADGPSWEFDSIPSGNFKLNSLRTHTLSLTFGWYF